MSIIQSIQNCRNQLTAINQYINQVRFDEHNLLVINHPQCQAAISLQGAHLLYWQPTDEQVPVIWLSEKALFKQGKAIRGGIPICWPWFGNSLTPAHGFARIVEWQLEHIQADDNGVEVILCLQQNDQTLQYWPHKFELQMKVYIGKTCKVTLSGQGDFSATSALHSYFGISDIKQITVEGLGEDYIEKLATVNPPKEIGNMTFDQEVDRIYTHPATINYIKDRQRTIKISHFTNSDVVIWNPWAEKSIAMSDFADDSYQHFICVETCRIHHPIMLTPQQFASYGVEIAVEK